MKVGFLVSSQSILKRLSQNFATIIIYALRSRSPQTAAELARSGSIRFYFILFYLVMLSRIATTLKLSRNSMQYFKSYTI